MSDAAAAAAAAAAATTPSAAQATAAATPAAAPATPAAPPPATPAEFKLTLPDGAKVDEKALGEFTAKAKEWGLSGKVASDLVAYQLATAAAQEKAYGEALAKQRTADLEALKSDKDFGGGKFEKTVADARSAAKQFFGEAGSKLFETLGIDNHPEIVKGLAKIRQLIAEDSIGTTTTNKGAAVTSEEARLRKMMPVSYDQIVNAKTA